MALEDIVNRINTDALNGAAKVKDEAEASANKIGQEASDRATTIREEILRDARAKAREDRQRGLIMANLGSRKQALAAKQALIEEAFEGAKAGLAGLGDREYLKLINKVLLEAVESGDELIIVSTKDRPRISPSFLEAINHSLIRKGKKARLRLSKETRDIKGGVILSSARCETDCSFETLIRELRDDLEIEVARILFGEKM